MSVNHDNTVPCFGCGKEIDPEAIAASGSDWIICKECLHSALEMMERNDENIEDEESILTEMEEMDMRTAECQRCHRPHCELVAIDKEALQKSMDNSYIGLPESFFFLCGECRENAGVPLDLWEEEQTRVPGGTCVLCNKEYSEGKKVLLLYNSRWICSECITRLAKKPEIRECKSEAVAACRNADRPGTCPLCLDGEASVSLLILEPGTTNRAGTFCLKCLKDRGVDLQIPGLTE